MKQITWLALLALLSTSAWGIEMEVPLSYDNAWVKTMQVIALEGIELSAVDKDSGVIQGSAPFDHNYVVCPALKGLATSYTCHISVAVQKKDQSSSVVSIQAKGSRESYQNDRHFLRPKTTIVTETKCESTGELENSLLKKIFNP
jgi:hypothetical protein